MPQRALQLYCVVIIVLDLLWITLLISTIKHQRSICYFLVFVGYLYVFIGKKRGKSPFLAQYFLFLFLWINKFIFVTFLLYKDQPKEITCTEIIRISEFYQTIIKLFLRIFDNLK